MAKLNAQDHNLIKILRIEKQWGAKRMITEFPNKPWSKTRLNPLCKQIHADCTIARKPVFDLTTNQLWDVVVPWLRRWLSTGGSLVRLPSDHSPSPSQQHPP